MTAVLRSKIKTIVPVRHGFIDGTGGIQACHDPLPSGHPNQYFKCRAPT